MTEGTRDWESLVVVGRVARAHGNRGRVIVNPETDFLEERFRPGGRLLTLVGGEIRELEVVDVRFQRGRPVMALAGVDTMNAAEALADHELRIPEDALSPLPAGSHYQHDLVGCEVTTVTGGRVGRVAAVQGAAGAHRLIVRDENDDRAEVDVPLVDAICVRVDIRGRSIVIDPPEGLVELNRR